MAIVAERHEVAPPFMAHAGVGEVVQLNMGLAAFPTGNADAGALGEVDVAGLSPSLRGDVLQVLVREVRPMGVGALLDDDERAVLRLPGVLFALALTAEPLLGGLVVAGMPLAH